jgi:hypothetical protein
VGSRRYIAFTLALVALSAVAVAAAKPGPSYRQALKRVDTSLRVATEQGPASLQLDIQASREQCEDAQEAEKSGDREAAAVGWRTLAQLVDDVDTPVWRVVIQASGRAHTQLDDLRATFSKAWQGQHEKVNTLNLGVAKTGHGVRLYLAAIREFSDAFDSWKQHDCAGAGQAIHSVNQHVPPAVKAINRGMDILESLR